MMFRWGSIIPLLVIACSVTAIYVLCRFGWAALMKSFELDLHAIQTEQQAEEVTGLESAQLKNRAFSLHAAAADDRVTTIICIITAICLAAGTGAFIARRW